MILEKSSNSGKISIVLINKYLYLFHKFYINFKVKSFHKIKLDDLKNLSFFQRMIIFNTNKNIINECEEIISFLLKILMHIIFSPNISIELIECIKEIISIF